MHTDGFRKLDLQLPRQRVYAVRPWLVAGLLLALAILLLMGGSYYRYKKETASRKETSSR